MSSACMTVSGELCLDSIHGAISQAVLGAFDPALNCVIANCMPAGFLITHFEILLSDVYTGDCCKIVQELFIRNIRELGTRNRSVSYMSSPFFLWPMAHTSSLGWTNLVKLFRHAPRLSFLFLLLLLWYIYQQNQRPSADGLVLPLIKP